MVVLRRRYNINESKQVGKLYHVCSLEAFVKYIIPTDTLTASGKYKNYIMNTNQQVSFTRDPSFVLATSYINKASIVFQFEVDGDSLSEHNKIIPYNDLHFLDNDTVSNREQEESVKGPIKNFKSYINRVGFDIKNPDIFYEDSKPLVKDLEEIQKYLGSIPCERVSLPIRYQGGSVISKKKKDPLFKIKTLSDLITALQDSDRDIQSIIDTEDMFIEYLYDKNVDEDVVIDILKKNPKYKDIVVNGMSLVDCCKGAGLSKVLSYLSPGEEVDPEEVLKVSIQSQNENKIIQTLKNYPELLSNTQSRLFGNMIRSAYYYNMYDLLKFLIDQGIKVVTRETVSMVSSAIKEPSRLEGFLKAGVPADIRDYDNKTLLMNSCEKGILDSVKLLIRYGADVNAKGGFAKNKTALNYAIDKSNEDIVQYLQSHGAKE